MKSTIFYTGLSISHVSSYSWWSLAANVLSVACTSSNQICRHKSGFPFLFFHFHDKRALIFFFGHLLFSFLFFIITFLVLLMGGVHPSIYLCRFFFKCKKKRFQIPRRLLSLSISFNLSLYLWFEFALGICGAGWVLYILHSINARWALRAYN